MSKGNPKTTGVEWLLLSLASFNGSGYADKTTPESYVASYRAYKQWKKVEVAVDLVDEYYDMAYERACQLVLANDAGHTPTDKNIHKFMKYYNPDNIGLL